MARGRRPEIFVRSLSAEEGARLQRTVRKAAKDVSPITWRRALVVLMSGQGRSAAQIATVTHSTEDWVREIIHAFNDSGMDALRPRWSGGRPRTITDEQRRGIVDVAKTRPQLLKEPYTRWSLVKLRDYLIRKRIVKTISCERLREILKEERVSLHRTKSWKRSPDPDFDDKAEVVEALYEHLPDAVVCFDEFGPVSPIPKGGWGWAAQELPQRIPANYRKDKGVQFFFGAYDVAADQLWGVWEPRKGGVPCLRFFKAIRRRYSPEITIHLVMDNLSAHWTDDIRAWAEHANVELVPTPTYASWLNRIEPEFGVMSEFVFANSDYRSHAEIQQATSAYLRRRNCDARVNFEARRIEKAKRRERRRRTRERRLERAA